MLARFLAGLPHGAFFGVGAVMGTAVVGPARRGQAVALMMTGLTVANVIGVPLSTAIGQRLGWRAAFLVVALLGLATLVALRRWTPPLASGPGASVRSELGALRNGQLWIACAAGAIGFGGMFAVYTYIAPLVTDVAGLAEATVPVVLALFGLGMTVGTVVGGRMADRSVLRTVVVGFVATAASLVLVALTGGEPGPRGRLGRAARGDVPGARARAADPSHGPLAGGAVPRGGAVPLGAQRGQRGRCLPRGSGHRGRVRPSSRPPGSASCSP